MSQRDRTFQTGISNATKEDFTPEGVQVAGLRQQLSTMLVCEVMDDHDPRGLGRVWVYAPGISPARYDGDSIPNEGGQPVDTAPTAGVGGEYDQQVRAGWIQVAPILPFSGSDAGGRGAFRTDGSSPAAGAGNSYGFQTQVRTGDFVACLFHNANPSLGFYFGTVPNPSQAGLIPGLANAAKDMVSSAVGSFTSGLTGSQQVPTYGTGDPTSPTPMISPASIMERNTILSGLINDPVRGLGKSVSNRESPTYTTGIKSAGWSYSTESHKVNALDPNGAPFLMRPDLATVNTTGHQLVMDDHPDHQLVRLRTSFGNQILLVDSGTDPFIYISTPTGGTWIEINDSGNINIYAQGDLNIHAEEELNITADAGINIQTDGDFNVTAKGKMNLQSEASLGLNTGGE
ncbi:MAG: hypothetical protein D6698_11420, partial [Gammaproteobacteria bacterium]